MAAYKYIYISNLRPVDNQSWLPSHFNSFHSSSNFPVSIGTSHTALIPLNTCIFRLLCHWSSQICWYQYWLIRWIDFSVFLFFFLTFYFTDIHFRKYFYIRYCFIHINKCIFRLLCHWSSQICWYQCWLTRWIVFLSSYSSFWPSISQIYISVSISISDIALFI